MTVVDQAGSLRDHVLELLRGKEAHASFDVVVADWPEELRGAKAAGVPYTAWQILEHMRIAQWDILEFSRNANHVSPQHPDGYWPDRERPQSAEDWEKSVHTFTADMDQMKALVEDESLDLFKPFAHGSGQTLLREALLVADHNAYHVGQLVVLRRLLGTWLT
ncbi:MAG: DinB family protein [Acidobacteria bacterium]|nr:DinB family protein [Acidobacteriota bacterium]